MTEHLKILMKTLEIRRMRTALEMDPETEEESPVLIRVVIAGKHKLIHPQNFVELLGENEQFIDPGTLEILDLDDIPSDEDWLKWGISQEMLDAKKAETQPEQPPEKPPEDKPAEEEVPPFKCDKEGCTEEQPHEHEEPGTPPDAVPPVEDTPPIWSEAELVAIGKQEDGYNKLRAISKLYDDIPGNISKAALIEKISGKAKP